ncbi:MAG: site-2 protease family protein [Candidatus Margulisiibacteriota bacterium]
MRGSFKLTQIFNLSISINYSWFIVLGLVVFSLAQGYFPTTNPELGLAAHWLMAFIAALLLFASLLAHEISHALVARMNQIPIHGITLFVFGGVAQLEKEPGSPMAEFKMAAAGPIMSFTLALIFFTFNRLFDFPSAVASIIGYLVLLNLIVGIFNLIPGFPLDGGRLLRAILWQILKDFRKATAIASNLGKGFAFFLMALGFMNLINGAFLTGIWLIFIGLFLREAADTSYRQAAMEKFLAGVKIERLMSRAIISVPADKTLAGLVEDYFLKYRHTAFPVIEDDNVLGLLTFHAIKGIPREEWATTTAKEIMLPLERKIIAGAEMDAMQALAKLSNNNVGRLLVFENSKLVGILSHRDIMRLFEFKSEIEG